jgi:very-short-patch-repair endonuclease
MTPRERLFESATGLLEEMVLNSCYSEAKKCESPIEVIFLEAVTLYHILHQQAVPSFSSKKIPYENSWRIEAQKQIGKFRVDFLIECPKLKTAVVVECDGHDFHERTKEQAAKDRSRDRSLTADGFAVLRFTGSELWRDPWKCAEEIMFKEEQQS